MENAEIEHLGLDRKTKRHFWEGSKSPELEKRMMTEHDLVAQAIEDSGLSADDFIKEAVIAKAKRSIAIGKSDLKAQGRAGSSQERLRNGLDLLERSGEFKGATQLMEIANTNYYTTLAFLNRTRPSALNDKQLDSLRKHRLRSKRKTRPNIAERLANAMASDKDISPSTLAKKAGTTYIATLKWLAVKHPNKLSESQLKKARSA